MTEPTAIIPDLSSPSRCGHCQRTAEEHVCRYGDAYAHSILDLIPAREWDPTCKPKATEPCPDGAACPAYHPMELYWTSTDCEPRVIR